MNETRRSARSAAVFYTLDAIIASAAFALDPGRLAHTAIATGAAVRTLAAAA